MASSRIDAISRLRLGPLAAVHVSGDELPAVRLCQSAGIAAFLQLLEAADRVFVITGSERKVGEGRLGRGHERQSRINFLDWLVLDQRFETAGGLGDRTRAAVKLGLPELHDLVFRVFFERGVEVPDGVGDVAPFQCKLSVEHVAGGRLLPASPNLTDDRCGLVEVIAIELKAE